MSPDPILERALELARAEVPPRLDANRARRMVELALERRAVVERGPDRTPRWRWLVWLAVPTTAAIALWLFAAASQGPDGDVRAPAELVLPTGDRIASVPGTQLDIAEATAPRRVLWLATGTALFDVQPLAAGEQFVVHTPDTEVAVTGTVFTVEVTADATTVRVYEGHVRARRGGVDHTLRAGSQLGPAGEVTALAGDALGTLAAVRAAARAGGDAPASAEHRPTSSSTRAAAGPARDESRPQEAPHDPAARPAPDALVRGATEGTTRPHATTTSPAPAPTTPAPDPSATDGDGAPDAARARPDRAEVVALLAAGKLAEARDLARANQWHTLEGDAHRGLGAHALAVDAYERAVLSGELDDACVGGLRAARLYADRLANRARALELLEHAARPVCPTRERALALALQLTTQMARPDLGREAARRYLAAFPDGPSAALARSLVAAP